jgi:hypothetical protein
METPKANARQAAPAVGTKSAAAAKGKRAVKGGSDQREMLLPIAGGAPATEAGRQGSARETNGAKKPAHGKRPGSLSRLGAP